MTVSLATSCATCGCAYNWHVNNAKNACSSCLRCQGFVAQCTATLNDGFDPTVKRCERPEGHVEDHQGPLQLNGDRVNWTENIAVYPEDPFSHDARLRTGRAGGLGDEIDAKIATAWEHERKAVAQFETKDSGERATFESGMQRDTDTGKARFELLHPLGVPYDAQFLTRVAQLMARGAEKYDERNWEKATGTEELERFKSSALRHLMQWVAGETDEDHASAVVFNLLGYETTKWKMARE